MGGGAGLLGTVVPSEEEDRAAMRTWEEDLTFPRGPFPPRRTDGGGVAFTAAQDDFAFAAVVTLPPLPAPAPPPEPTPEPDLEALASTPAPEPETKPRRGLFRRRKSAPPPVTQPVAPPVAQPVTGSAPDSVPASIPAAVPAAVPVPVPVPAPVPVPVHASMPVAEAPAASLVDTRVADIPAECLPDEPVLSVVGEDAIETEPLDAPAPRPAKRRRIGRKKAAPEPGDAAADHDEAREPATIGAHQEPTAETTAPAPAEAAVVEASLAVATIEAPGTAEREEASALLSEPRPAPEESPVDAWLTRARASVTAGAQPGWSPPVDDSSDAGGLPPRNGHARGEADVEPEPEAEADDTEEQEEGSARRRRGRKARRTQAPTNRPGARRLRRKGAPAGEAPAQAGFVPSFGFAAHPVYDVKWAAAAHWATIPLLWVGLGFLAPFVVLAARGEQSQFVRSHATASLNFQLSLLIYMLLTGFLGVLTPLLFVIPILVGILGATAAWFATKAARASSEARYPFALPIF